MLSDRAGDASLADPDPSTEDVSSSRAHGLPGRQRRRSEALRLVARVAVGIATLLVWAGVARAAQDGAKTVDVASVAQPHTPTHHWRDGAPLPDLALEACESTLEEEDPSPDVRDVAALSSDALVTSRKLDGCVLDEGQRDPSPLGAGTGLARAPPV